MTDIQIKTYEPGGDKADLGITVDGVEYTVYWYDHDGEPQFFGPDLGEKETAIRARIELFFTFFDHGALRVYTKSLTQDAVYEMTEHLAKNAAGAEPWCNHDAVAVVDGVCECGVRVDV